MTIRTFRLLATYNILTPAALLGLAVVSPALAQDITNNSPQTSGQGINSGFGYTNNSTIDESSGTALYGDVVTFINNASGAAIVSRSYGAGIGINSLTGTLTNSGHIEAVFNGPGVYIDGNANTFINNGTILGYYDGVHFEGMVSAFTNTGRIQSLYDGRGVYGRSDVTTFVNSGEITGYYQGVWFEGAIASFLNSGNITGHYNEGVRIGDHVDSFINSGNISSYDDTAVEIGYSYGSNGNNGTITNSGNVWGAYGGFDIYGNVTSFRNEASGVINGQYSDGVAFYNGGSGATIGSFFNAGSIRSNNEAGVYFQYKSLVHDFTNTGAISGNYAGVYSDGWIDLFTNAAGGSITGDGWGVALVGDPEDATGVTVVNNGLISGRNAPGLVIGARTGSFGYDPESNALSAVPVTSVTNTGTITGRHIAVWIDNDGPTTIVNTGMIATSDLSVLDRSFFDLGSVPSIGLFFNGGMLTNSGTIKGGIGVVVDVQNDTTIVNSGSIVGTNGPGIAFVDSSSIPDPTVVNSGLISGSAGIAVDFGATSPDNLILQTGGKFIGDIAFGGGTNTFDFSGYRGNILVGYTGADPTLVSGPGLFAQSGKQVAIMDDTAIRNAAQPIEDLVHGVRNGIADAQGATGDVMSTTLVSSYGPTAKSTPAAGAADTMASPFGMTGYTAWGSLIGGGSTNSGGSKTSTMYGGIIGGAQSEVQPGVVIGLLGGFGRTSLDVVTGPQTVTGNTGVLGVYGKAALDPVELEFSALAGLGANTSLRTVSTGTGDQTATGNFGSWFLAPELAAAIPVMVNDKGEIGVKGKVGYIAGGFSGYTETGSSSNATVGAETIGIFESSIELDGSTVLKSTDAGDVTLTGKVGLFAQVNVGGSNVPVSLLGVATAGSSASGASGYGVFGGVGINAPVSANMSVGAGFDGSVRSDGTVSGAAKVKLAGSF